MGKAKKGVQCCAVQALPPARVLGSDVPHKRSVEQVERFILDKAPQHRCVFDNAAFDDFRLLSERNSLEDFVMSLPRVRVGRILFHFFQTNKPHSSGDVELRVYGETALSRVVRMLVLFILVFFFLLPLALITYHAVGRTASASLIFVQCLLACVFASRVSNRIDVQFRLVFAYGAIMAAFVTAAG
ncbi:hypothetical protein NKR23_g5196 [Pleurostoma richardsiae]|uniref:Uncharacterized protein n=1 Tax=Pleurostoma richardsiae TaxID=41990 RepID=A0AA38VF58_9PEZI|nr:hypothetical protein NKR23_g5196 [Pleurostoma richardsiae]